MRRAAAIAGAVVLALAVAGRRMAMLRPSAGRGTGLEPAASPEARAKLETLDEILRSKDDNDPRLDRDFNALTREAKELFRREYRAFPPERRNERGTIVYLLGKNLSAPEDWAFLREVAGEPPCLSLQDCSRPPPGPRGEAVGDDVTLAYPSLVALKQAERAWLATRSPEARGVIEAGARSRSPAVVRLAAKLEPQLR